MTNSYKIDPTTWHDVLKDNYERLSFRLKGQDDIKRWRRQIDTLMLRPVTMQQIMDGIQWALQHEPRNDRFTPGPKDIASWIRKSSHEESERFQENPTTILSGDHRPYEIWDKGKKYIRMTEEQCEEVRIALRACVENIGRPNCEIEAEEDGDIILAAGEALRPTDYYRVGEEWVLYGDDATDSNGKPLRFMKYGNTSALRKAK